MRLRFESFKQNIRMALVFTLCMVAFTVIAMSAGDGGADADSPSHVQHGVEDLAASASKSLVAPPKGYGARGMFQGKSIADIRGDLYRQLQSGPRSSSEIQNEIAQMVGDTNGIEFNKKNINRAYKLSIVMSHYKNMLNDPYEILLVHTFADNDRAEDKVTFYTRKIDGAEERNTHGQMTFSRLIEINDKGQPQFAASTRFNYKFELESHPIKRTFDLRAPVASYQMTGAPADSFDPLVILTNADSPFDYGLYHHEISYGGKNYDVQISVRPTELETLTFEIRLQEAKSLISQSYILVYEEL